MDVGRAAEGAEVRQVGVVSMEGRVGDGVRTCGPRYIADVDHDDEGVTPETIVKACREE